MQESKGLRELATEIDEIADALWSTNALRGRQLRNIAMRVKRAAASDSPAAPPDETAWLIERGGLCLGFCDHKTAWVTFTNETALRLSRRSDAVRFIEAFRSQMDLEGVLITEHMWRL